MNLKGIYRLVSAWCLPAFGLVLFACSHSDIPFDRTQWNLKDDLRFPYREQMLNDLMRNHPLKGMNMDQLTELLGVPEKNVLGSQGEIYYEIRTKYDMDIHPTETKMLVFILDDNRIVTGFKVKEWELYRC